jgi:hypothetical protein
MEILAWDLQRPLKRRPAPRGSLLLFFVLEKNESNCVGEVVMWYMFYESVIKHS